MPAIPNFMSLAQMQGGINQQSANQTTQANRPNQTNPYGTLSWSQGPDGQWTQNVGLNSEYADRNSAVGNNQDWRLQSAATQFPGINGALDTSGLSDWGSTDITRGVSQMPDGSFGASQQVIDAMKGLQQPGLNQARDAERARLAAMGITLGSDASNNSERVLGGTQNDADLKAILAGTQEYGNVFNRQLAQRQQGVDENIKTSTLANALRQAQTGEKINLRASNLATLNGLTGGIERTSPSFSPFATASALPPPNLYGAARDTFDAELSAENAARARSQNRQQGNLGIAQAGLGMLGGAGGLLSSGMGMLGNMWGNATGTPGSDSWFANLGNNGDQTNYLDGGDALGDFGTEQGWW